MLESAHVTNNISFAWQVAIIVFFVIIFIAWLSSETSEKHKKQDTDFIILQTITHTEKIVTQKIKEEIKKLDEAQTPKLNEILAKLN
jgi:hypothetical protein